LAGALLVALFWPVRGWFWRLAHALRATERVHTEDALKHMHDCEYGQQPCTLQGLAGALDLSDSQTEALLSGLEERGLAEAEDDAWTLTPEGRTYALRVVRIHRLWERYLSEETGLEPAEWHVEAHRLEHRTSPEQADALAARMGHPRYDPHGDPIPTAGGEIVPPQGQPLPELPVDRWAEIVHMEDEPEAVYAQLVAERLHRGMRVRILEVSAQRIRFETETDEHVLAPIVAANLTVAPLPEEETVEADLARLSSLEIGEEARVVGIAAGCRGAERRRLLDLGVIPGSVVAAEMRSPGGDPVAYRIRGAVVALRREQADLIHVSRRPEGEAA
jgi:DtxR family Mn-dependent transcriptional regulator